MFEARGLKTGTLYHAGETKAECHRLLIEKYPTYKEASEDSIGRPNIGIKTILPEPIMIKHKGASFRVGGILY